MPASSQYVLMHLKDLAKFGDVSRVLFQDANEVEGIVEERDAVIALQSAEK